VNDPFGDAYSFKGAGYRSGFDELRACAEDGKNLH